MISESSLFRKIKELNQLLAAFELQIKMDNYREKIADSLLLLSVVLVYYSYEIHQKKRCRR